MEFIARRRRLNLDYQIHTNTLLDNHCGHARWARKTAYRCLIAVRRQFLPHYFAPPPLWRVWLRDILTDRSLPDFCIIGPLKSGTSDLAITIMSHPNVLCPLVKEFSSTDPMTWRPFYPTVKAVRRHARLHGAALCAFVGPCLHCLDIPTTLSALRPDIKIIINLRNPSDLVFSVWKWSVINKERQLVDRLPFLATFPAFVDKAIELFPESPSPFGIGLHCGIYASCVSHWLRTFGERNVLIFDIAEYFKDRNVYFDRLQQFLGLPHISLPPRLPVANSNPLANLAVPPETSAKLKEFFEPHNRRLWDVIGKTYSW